MRIGADINQSILDAQSRRDAMEFQSFIKGESAKRAMAWEMEKTELSQQHDFDLQIQRKDLENQLSMQREAREKNKLETKMRALDDAAERGDISPKEAADEKLRLEIGVSGSQSRLFSRDGDDLLLQQFLNDRAGTGVSPEQKNSSALLALGKAIKLSKGDQEDVDAILAEGDSNKIKQTLDILQARAKIEEGPGFLKSISPVGAISEVLRLGRLKRKAGVPEELKRPRSRDFSSFSQSMGSFR